MSKSVLEPIIMQASLCWPSRAKTWLFLKINLALYVLFVVIYGGANYLASLQSNPYYFFAEWERDVPLVPVMIYVYLSISLLFWVPLFVLDKTRIKRLGMAATICILIAGLFFILLPSTTGFAAPTFALSDDSLEVWLFRMVQHVDTPYNMAPSLHVGLSTVVVLATIQSDISRLLSTSLMLWLCMIMLSVVLVHQHHFVDVLTGWALGYGCYLQYRR
jgi:membrane-associated phospholipid phosphatase